MMKKTMYNNDTEILTAILKKEADFKKEISRLSDCLTTKKACEDISDYLTCLNDLKSDFLLPAQESLSSKETEKGSLFSDKYWYFQRT